MAEDTDTDEPPAVPPPERLEAARILSRARRLHAAARAVQGRRLPGGIESAFIAHRSLTLALDLLVRLRGSTPASTFAELVAQARVIASEEHLLTENSTDDLMTIDEMRSRLDASEDEVSLADDRRYDRALLRSKEWLGAVSTYVDQKVPSGEARLRQYATVAMAVVSALGVGFLVGRHTPAHTPMTEAAAPVTGTDAPGFDATFFRDPNFKDVAFKRRHDSIAFDWRAEAPIGLEHADRFSVRWEGKLVIDDPGEYTFYLASDDGARLFIDDALVVDNWGNHTMIDAERKVKLSAGAHALRVDYFDGLGMAAVRLEWSSASFARRLITSTDLR